MDKDKLFNAALVIMAAYRSHSSNSDGSISGFSASPGEVVKWAIEDAKALFEVVYEVDHD